MIPTPVIISLSNLKCDKSILNGFSKRGQHNNQVGQASKRTTQVSTLYHPHLIDVPNEVVNASKIDSLFILNTV